MPQFIVIYAFKGFGIVNKAEIDVFLELSCFFDDPVDVGNLISGSSAFPKTSLNTWKFTVHILLKPGLENFEHYFSSIWDEYNCAVVWAFFGIVFLWDWNEGWPFPVLWPLLHFPHLLAYLIHSAIFSESKLFCLSYYGGLSTILLEPILASNFLLLNIKSMNYLFKCYFIHECSDVA